MRENPARGDKRSSPLRCSTGRRSKERSRQYLQLLAAALTELFTLLALLSGSAEVNAYLCPSPTERGAAALINYERLRNGLTPLKIEARLTEAARLHSQDMAIRNFFSHYTNPEVCDANPNSPDCIGPDDRIDWTGYLRWTYGENIAAGYQTPRAAVTAWMNSTGHKANILNSSFRDIGVGYYSGAGKYYYYWNADFASGSNPIQTPLECVPLRLGVFRNGNWYVDYSKNMLWDAPPSDRSYAFGTPGDRPVLGDWNGNGLTGLGVFRSGSWFLDLNGNGVWEGPANDGSYIFGQAGDVPVIGDWNDDGRAKIGVFRSGLWALDVDGSRTWTVATDQVYFFGQATDIPVTGDWNGDGITEIGVFRSGSWYLDYNGNGAWDGCGTTWSKDRCFTFGVPSDIPVSGDWNGDGITEIGVFRNGTWVLDMNGNGAWDGVAVDKVATFGLATDRPMTGNW